MYAAGKDTDTHIPADHTLCVAQQSTHSPSVSAYSLSTPTSGVLLFTPINAHPLYGRFCARAHVCVGGGVELIPSLSKKNRHSHELQLRGDCVQRHRRHGRPDGELYRSRGHQSDPGERLVSSRERRHARRPQASGRRQYLRTDQSHASL